MQAVDAHLKNARWHSDWPDRLIGEIYQDDKNRFRDGEIVVTSPAEDIGQGMFKTRSGTIYQVDFKRPASLEFKRNLVRYLTDCVIIGNDNLDRKPIEVDDCIALGGATVVVVMDAGAKRTFKFTAEEIL